MIIISIDLNLVGIINDLVSGGSETVTYTANFAIRYWVQYPDVQTKMYEEIDRVVGKDRWITLDDKPKYLHIRSLSLYN